MLTNAYMSWNDMPSTHRPIEPIETDVFTAIAHPVRRKILHSLLGSSLTVTDLAEPFVVSGAISRSAVSQHLTVLLDSGLVAVEKRGREHFYRLRPENLNEV